VGHDEAASSIRTEHNKLRMAVLLDSSRLILRSELFLGSGKVVRRTMSTRFEALPHTAKATILSCSVAVRGSTDVAQVQPHNFRLHYYDFWWNGAPLPLPLLVSVAVQPRSDSKSGTSLLFELGVRQASDDIIALSAVCSRGMATAVGR